MWFLVGCTAGAGDPIHWRTVHGGSETHGGRGRPQVVLQQQAEGQHDAGPTKPRHVIGEEKPLHHDNLYLVNIMLLQ